MTGSPADDWFIGGEGADTLNGGLGGTHDIIDYSLDAIGAGLAG